MPAQAVRALSVAGAERSTGWLLHRQGFCGVQTSASASLSPRPLSSKEASSSSARDASGASDGARKNTSLPRTRDNPMTATRLLASAVFSPQTSCTEKGSFLAASASLPAGRACRPFKLGMMTRREASHSCVCVWPAGAAFSCSPCSRGTVNTMSCPALTSDKENLFNCAPSGEVTIKMTKLLGAFLAKKSGSNSVSFWPRFTSSPALTNVLKPFPCKLTVSTPT